MCVLPCNTLHSVKLNNNQLDEMLFLFSLHFKSSKFYNINNNNKKVYTQIEDLFNSFNSVIDI